MARGVDQSIPDSLGSRPQKLRFIVDPKLWAAYISVRMHGHWKDEGDREYGNSESIKSLDCEMVKGVKALVTPVQPPGSQAQIKVELKTDT